jgi:uncharacterized protein YegP (UPF0339 family)
MAGKFELKKTTNGQFMFNLKASNGQVILTSETYTSKAGATNGITAVKQNAPIDSRYDRRTSGKNQPYFVLKAGNNEPLGKSEMYSSSAAMENGIQSVKDNAPTAPTDDQT